MHRYSPGSPASSRDSGSPASQASIQSAYTVLPPVITNEADRVFLHELNQYLDREMGRIDPDSAEQKYTVHKAAFDRIIEHVTAYKPLLTAVKAEYEEFIETIHRGKREAAFLTGKLKAMASEPSTRRNYKRRAEELEHKLTIVRDDNERLTRQVQNLRDARVAREKHAKQTAEAASRPVKKEKERLQGLSLQQSTDVKFLSKELARLEQQAKELQINGKTKYTTKDNKEILQDQLTQKVNRRDELAEQGMILKGRQQKLRVALEATRAYFKIQPPHQTVGDAIMMALAQNKGEKGTISHTLVRDTPSTSFDDDDPTREKEAEMMLEYIEKFNELFEEGKYEEAAIHAANSPKGILRTIETLKRFKELKAPSGGRPPLLAFCDALMSSVLALGVKPSETISMECVKCALDENRIDLLSHWISQDRLTVTQELGSMINTYCEGKSRNHLALAESVFVKVKAHRHAVVAMVRQGRIQAAIEYSKTKGHFKTEDYLYVLNECPTLQYASAVSQPIPAEKSEGSDSGDEDETSQNQTEPVPASLLPVGVIVRTLIDKNLTEIGLLVLQEVFNRSPKSDKGSSDFHQAIFADEQTTSEQWMSIVQSCQQNGYEDIAIEILAAITVQGAMRKAVVPAKRET